MQPFPVSVYPELTESGAFRALSGVLDEASYRKGGDTFATPDGIAYDLALTNTGEAILLTGTVSAKVETRCDRCLEPAIIEVSGDVEGYYLLEPAEELDGYERDEFDSVSADGSFDISGPILAALVFATPYVILCREDCKGLCRHCGANLNEGPCGCKDDAIDPLNPFSSLAGLDLGGE